MLNDPFKLYFYTSSVVLYCHIYMMQSYSCACSSYSTDAYYDGEYIRVYYCTYTISASLLMQRIQPQLHITHMHIALCASSSAVP